MAAASRSISVDRTEGVVVIRLNRPEVLNAISTAVADELVRQLREDAQDDGTKAVILTGSGDRAFSAGVDLNEAVLLRTEEVEAWFRKISNVYRAILTLDKPVIAALNGIAAGAGFQSAMAADLRVGCTRTEMAQPEINAGVPSIMGSYLMTFYLPRSINQEMSFTGRSLDAEECVRYGLLNDMVSPGDLIERAAERAADLTAKSPTAFRLTKARFRDLVLSGFDPAFEAAVQGLQAAFKAGEAQAAMRGFLASHEEEGQIATLRSDLRFRR